MKNKFIGIWAVLICAFLLAFTACASPTVTPTALPPDAPPAKKALQFYEFYSPM
jgi:hypothetical protein